MGFALEIFMRAAGLVIAALSLLVMQGCGEENARKKPAGSGEQSGDGSSEKCEADILCIRVKPGAEALLASLETFPGIELTLSFDMTLSNLHSSAALPAVFDLNASTVVDVTSLTPKDTKAAYSYNYSYRYGWGRRNVTHAEGAVYRLPFETGTARQVIQGYNGTFTHQGNDAFAIDFSMPEGTKILAARDGVVLDLVESFIGGGTSDTYKDKANAVRIVHEDGTVANYLHLKLDGVEVKRGSAVRAGDLLGYSGNTGYSSEPHLHFDVSKRIDVETKSTLPTVFKTNANSSGETLSQGTSYTSID